MVVAYRIFVSAPVPFGFRSYWDLVGDGPRGFWFRVRGQGLTIRGKLKLKSLSSKYLFFGMELQLLT